MIYYRQSIPPTSYGIVSGGGQLDSDEDATFGDLGIRSERDVGLAMRVYGGSNSCSNSYGNSSSSSYGGSSSSYGGSSSSYGGGSSSYGGGSSYAGDSSSYGSGNRVKELRFCPVKLEHQTYSTREYDRSYGGTRDRNGYCDDLSKSGYSKHDYYGANGYNTSGYNTSSSTYSSAGYYNSSRDKYSTSYK